MTAPPAEPEDVPGPRRGRRRVRLEAHHVIALSVGALYLVASLIIFRDVLFAIPSILRGERVLAGDELVPFFNADSQLIEQAQGDFSELTNGYEFRVRYAFLTTWVRHYAVLPFAVLLGLPLIVWGAYLVTSWFVARVFRTLDRSTVYLATALPTALIYMIMIYAKITHFYTLILGLMLMTVSAFVMLDALLFRRRRWGRRMVLACVVVLLNPAVHYLVLFSLFLVLTAVTLTLGEVAKWARSGGPRAVLRALRAPWRGRIHSGLTAVRASGRRRRLASVARRLSDTTIGRVVWAFVALVVVTLIPYGLFVKFVALRGVPNLSETVPGDYYFISDASVSLAHILSWDLAGIMDKVNFGDYLAKVPRVSNMIYMVVVLLPLVVPGLRRSLFPSRPHRQLLGVIYVNVGFAVWATVGYADPSWFPTFHRSLASVTRAMAATHSPLGDITVGISSTIVQVLRFPHRFQLILFMLGPLLMTLPLGWAIDRLHGRVGARRADAADADAGGGDSPVGASTSGRAGRRAERATLVTRVALTVALGSVFFGPFLSNEPYRSAYGSGDFDDFLSAYPVGDLHDLKEHLLTLPEGKTVVLPPTETAKLVIDTDGVPHKFIDKFYIYYLDQPSFYYGLTGDKENKFEFFLMLRALYYQQDWWVNVARDIGLEYIVLNKQVENNRGVGAEYLPDLETYLRTDLEAVPDWVEPLYENDSFVLYRLTDPAPEDRPVLLFDTSWKGYLDTVFSRLDLSRCYDFQYISGYEGTTGEPVQVVTDDVTSAALDVWADDHPGSFSVPSTKGVAFNPDVVSSSYYLSPMFRLFLFFSDTKWNRTEMITPGIFGTLDGSFVGLPRATEVTIPVVVPEDGRYRVLLRTAATANDLEVTSRTLGLDTSLEVRSPADALQLFDTESVYDADRQAVDTSGLSVEELEGRIPDDLVPVNLRYTYQDLGVVDATAGAHQIVIDKTDDNPMLLEGALLVPEDVYQGIELPPSMSVVTDPSELDCAETHDVRTGLPDSVDAIANDPHADLTQEQVLDLLGAQDFPTASPGGIGGRWLHLGATALLILASIAVIRWHARHDPDRDRNADRDRDRDRDSG